MSPSVDLNADRGPKLAAYNAAMIAIPTLAVVIRFWSRSLSSNEKHRKFWWDDWTALIALPWCVASNALAITIIHLGVGKHIAVVPMDNVLKILKVLFATYIVYDTGLTLAKMSALFFLARVFETHSKTFRHLLLATHALVWAWWFGIIFGTIFMCNPVQKNWLPTIEGHCGSTEALWIGSAVPSVLIDLIILILPLPMLWNLHLPRARKLLLIGVFVCGYCVILVSLGRLITVIRSGEALNEDLTWAGVPALYWLGAETPITLLSISLPSVFFLLRRARQHGPASLFSSRLSGSRIPLGQYSRTGPASGVDANSNTELRNASHGSTSSVQNIYVGPDAIHKATVDASPREIHDRQQSDLSAAQPGIHVSSKYEVSRG